MNASVLILISPTTHGLSLPIHPSYCLCWELTVLVLTHCMGHRDSSSAFCYCNWENLLVHGLSHPGDGLLHAGKAPLKAPDDDQRTGQLSLGQG